MSTRAAIIIRDDRTTLHVYRHSDGYPECTGADLKEFVSDYTSGALRLNVDQSAGWLIVRGHFDYKSAHAAPITSEGVKLWPDEPDRTGARPDPSDRSMGWKVGAYEPTSSMHGDEEYVYIIDLVKRTLTCRQPVAPFWDEPTLENTRASKKFKTVRF